MANKLAGLLHLYNPNLRLSAFESGKVESCCTLIFIGGLGEGFYAVPYIQTLGKSLEDINFSLTQTLLSSSYTGFGFRSVADDADDIQRLLDYLRSTGKTTFVLLGHSTGCQDIIQFFNTEHDSSDSDPFKGIIGIILQAPVSDREYIVDSLGEEKFRNSLQIAQKLADAGQSSEPIPSEFSDVLTGGHSAISASRWLSFARSAQDYSKGEDFFSSDLPEEVMNVKLNSIARKGVAAMVLISGEDETMPKTVDKKLLLQRIVDGLTTVPYSDHQSLKTICQRWSTVLPGAGHAADEVKEELCSRIVDFINDIL